MGVSGWSSWSLERLMSSTSGEPGSRRVGPGGTRRPRRPKLSRLGLRVGEFGLDYEALFVVWEGAGLEREDVLARLGLRYVGVRGVDDEGFEDRIGVFRAVRVCYVDLVPHGDLVEVPEG